MLITDQFVVKTKVYSRNEEETDFFKFKKQGWGVTNISWYDQIDLPVRNSFCHPGVNAPEAFDARTPHRTKIKKIVKFSNLFGG